MRELLERTRGNRGTLVAVLAYLLLATVVPATVTSLQALSILPILIYGSLGALHVYLMLRVNRLSFASTGFMAIGGYTMALVAMHVTANVIVVAIAAFVVPALVAVLLGLLVLRLRGTYFVLVSFVFAEIVVLVVINNKSVLGGNSGLSGVPVLSLFGTEFGDGAALLVISAVLALLGALAVAAVTIRYRRELAAIEQHESLALSLGLRVPLFTTMCLAVAAGAAGLGGAVLVNTIGNAQTNSFDPLLAVDHVAYAVVGGGGSMLGVLVGSLLLGWLSQALATHSEYAEVIYGVVLILVVLYARGGLAGIGVSLARRVGGRRTPTPTTAAAEDTDSNQPAPAPPGVVSGELGQDPTRHSRPCGQLADAGADGGASATGGDREPLSSGASTTDDVAPANGVETDGVETAAGPGGGVGAAAATPEPDGGTGERLRVSGLTKAFGGVRAVSDVDLTLGEGEVLGIIGPNGAGKTTLVSLIAGTVRASAGRVLLENRDITRVSPAGRCRRGLGRSYQQTAVFAPATVAENLERARRFSGARMSETELSGIAGMVGLTERADAVAGELPYGLQKMLGLVMALATDPKVLLLDEPAAGLESSERPRIDALVAAAQARGASVLLVEHDMDLVRRLCTRLVVLDGGELLTEGDTERVLAEPAVIAAYLGEAEEQVEAVTVDG